MSTKLRVVSVAVWAALISSPALAHHSGAMFDMTKEMVVSGTVVSWQFTNPHSWLWLAVPGVDGKVTRWGFEGGSPAGGHITSTSRTAKDTFKVGDKVSVRTHPMKDGRPAGTLSEVTFADGRVWRGVGSLQGAPQVGR